MRLSIAHTTTYAYDVPFVGESYMEARLRPLTAAGEQVCREFRLTTDPSATIFEYNLAAEGNSVSHFTIKDAGHRNLVIHAESVVDTLIDNPFADVELDAGDWTGLADPAVRNNQAEWLPSTPLTNFFADPELPQLPRESVFEYAQALMEFIYSHFEYVPGSTDVSTPLETFVNQRRGVCQDYAHLMIAIARAAGVPSRYVSGYVSSGSNQNTHGSDATHAWAELYLPKTGVWKGFDPTNNVVVAGRHVKIGTGRDYNDVPPTKGLLRPGRGYALPTTTELLVDVRITEVATSASVGT